MKSANRRSLIKLAGDGVLAATDPKLPYGLTRDYAFISTVIQFPFLIMVKADSKIKTLADAIDAAKKNSGKPSFATPGIRTTQHLAGENTRRRHRAPHCGCASGIGPGSRAGASARYRQRTLRRHARGISRTRIPMPLLAESGDIRQRQSLIWRRRRLTSP